MKLRHFAVFGGIFTVIICLLLKNSILILFQLHIVALDAMNVSMPIIQFRIYQRDILV